MLIVSSLAPLRAWLSRLSLLLYLLFPALLAQGQTPIAVLDFDCGNRRMNLGDFLLGKSRAADREDCGKVQAMVMDALYNDSRVQVVIPEIIPAVEAERELQKDEDFLAGYVVEQWNQQGAEYLLTGQVLPGSQELVLQIHRVEDRSLAASQVQSFKVGLLAPASEQRSLVEQGLQLLLTDFFRIKIPIVKVLAGSNKARLVLVAGGNSQGFRLHQELQVRVEGRLVGSVVVEEVEGNQFSRCRVIRGGREMAEALNTGQTVEVEIIKI